MLNIFSLYFEPWHFYFKKNLGQILAAYVSIFWLTFSVYCYALARLNEIYYVSKGGLGRVCKVQDSTVGAKHLYLDIWLKLLFCIQMLRPHWVCRQTLAYPDTSISTLNLSAFYPVRKPTTMANTKREPWCINPSGTNHSVIIGIGGMSVVYRWETGVLVVDVVELDEKGKGKVVRAFYGKA